MNLTKKQTILILLTTLFFCITTSAVYLLTPYEIEPLEDSDLINKESNDIITDIPPDDGISIKTSNNVTIENIQLLDSNSTISAKVTVPSEDISTAFLEIFPKLNNKKIKNPRVDSVNNAFKISFDYKIIAGFHTSVIALVKPSIEENILHLTIPTVSVGKLQLNDKIIDFAINKFIKNKSDKINFKDSTISLRIEDISPQLTISDFTMNENNLTLIIKYSLSQSIFNSIKS